MNVKQKNIKTIRRRGWLFFLIALIIGINLLGINFGPAIAAVCERNISADVVALDKAFFLNRLGAAMPHGMIYALKGDVVPISGSTLSQGNAQLRPDKRARPIVLRMNVGDCLTINFQNLLAPAPVDDEQPATRTAGIHVIGMQLVGGSSLRAALSKF